MNRYLQTLTTYVFCAGVSLFPAQPLLAGDVLQVERIRSRFVEQFAPVTGDFTVEEGYARGQEVRTWFQRALPVDVVSNAQDVWTSRLVIKVEEKDTWPDLGLLRIRFKDALTAEKAHTKLKSNKVHFFQNSKLMMPFTSLLAKDTILVLYTEAAGDERMRSFLKVESSGHE